MSFISKIQLSILCLFCLSLRVNVIKPTLPDTVPIPESKVVLGAYYFDGWTGAYPYHITPMLRDSFVNRQPSSGWITSSQKSIDEQIQQAHNAGLSFFNFCWYPNKAGYKTLPLNNALSYYLKSSKKGLLKFGLMVANHPGFELGPDEWPLVCKELIRLCKADTYIAVDGKPLLTFFSMQTLIKKFGNCENVRMALNELKTMAKQNGLKGLSLAVCLYGSEEEVRSAKACGFDILTGYNYHRAGFSANVPTSSREIAIVNLQKGERKVWNSFANHYIGLPYIPVSTLNWDPRPWASKDNDYSTAPYFVGYSEKSVCTSVKSCIDWMDNNQYITTKEKLAILYAWNEYGEGAWLTPSKNMRSSLLRGVRAAIN